jgi:D-sedoheptulose 7-phosphate isomerase
MSLASSPTGTSGRRTPSPAGDYASRYFATLHRIARAIRVTDRDGTLLDFDGAIERLVQLCRDAAGAGGKLMFIGNGGSASIASHMAIDFAKNGRQRAVAFNDPMVITCLGNDLGFENIFAFQIEQQADPEDLLIAISSSGRSANILNGVTTARRRGSTVTTMSGFDENNPLRSLGDLNFHVPAAEYGYVEMLHASLCHCVLDRLMGIKTD